MVKWVDPKYERDYKYEKELQGDLIEEIEKKYGDSVWVLKSNELVRIGVPDLLICFFGHFVAIELKRKHRKDAPQSNVAERNRSVSEADKKDYPLQAYNVKKINSAGGSAFFGRSLGLIMERLEKIRVTLDPITMRCHEDESGRL